jgi:hypothetical protein
MPEAKHITSPTRYASSRDFHRIVEFRRITGTARFAGGRIRSAAKFSEARQQEALLTYGQSIQQAFRGVLGRAS